MRRQSRVKLALIAGVIALTGIVAGGSASFAETLVIPGLGITVFVDVDHCSQTSSLCSGSGSVGPAAGGNDSIVAIVIHTTRTGLAETAFSLTSITNAGSGITPQFVTTATCAACFLEVEPRVYRLAARPSSGNWGAGTYMVLLKVVTPGPDKAVVAPIDIP